MFDLYFLQTSVVKVLKEITVTFFLLNFKSEKIAFLTI